MKKFDKKGQVIGLGDLSGVAIGVLVFVIVVSIGAVILAEVQQTQTNNTVAFNTTADGLTGISLFGDFVSIIVLVAIAAVILGLISLAFRGFGGV